MAKKYKEHSVAHASCLIYDLWSEGFFIIRIVYEKGNWNDLEGTISSKSNLLPYLQFSFTLVPQLKREAYA